MADFTTETKPAKSKQLVLSAQRVFHEQGVERTTIADIAEGANVPVGNVYYYFKTKDQLVAAAIHAHARDIDAMLVELGRRRAPRARLKALARALAANSDLVAQHGCPIGSLCSELSKRDDGRDRDAAALLTTLINWAERQFEEMGRHDAHDLAIALVAAYEGIALLTNTLRDPEVMTRQTRRLERWIDSLA